MTPDSPEIFALLENRLAASDAPSSLLFSVPVEEIVCRRPCDLDSCFERIEECRKKRLWLCGYVSYEAGRLLALRGVAQMITTAQMPLLHFFAFRERRCLTDTQVTDFLQSQVPHKSIASVHDLALAISQADYLERIYRIHQYQREGHTYQVNFTTKYTFSVNGNRLALFIALREKQKVEFGAYLQFPGLDILSLSPELFLRKTGTMLITKPMKGTAARSVELEADRDAAIALRNDPKSRSENAMIVDMLRSDIGRIARPGSVQVRDMFEVQTFETLHQLVSTVSGEIDLDISLHEVFSALFPCGSVTGAPKIRTMEIIREVEDEPRGVYCGAIGFVTPENDFCFNVPIRTCVVRDDGSAEMGVGSGILYESEAGAEFQECRLKAQFLACLQEPFD